MPHPSLTKTRILDISVPIHPRMPVYPGDPGVEYESVMVMDTGSPANVTRLHIGSQTGTHFDAPHHILNDRVTMEQIPLELCYGEVLVLEIPEAEQAITGAVLEAVGLNGESGCERILLKTRNSGFWQSDPERFRTDFAAPTPDGAQYLVDCGARLVGIDYLSIELFDSEGLGCHKTLMNNQVVILEGLNLTDVAPGRYTLIAMPVKYQGLDGAPTRAVLLAEE